mgnify:CR=1 FL=1
MFKRKIKARSAPDDSRSFPHPSVVEKAGVEACAVDDRSWKLIEVLYDQGPYGYAVATGRVWNPESKDYRHVCAIRWNGDYHGVGSVVKKMPDSGSPQVGGVAEWFVLPEFLWESTIDTCRKLKENGLSHPTGAPT